jgi:hypothetical protein
MKKTNTKNTQPNRNKDVLRFFLNSEGSGIVTEHNEVDSVQMIALLGYAKAYCESELRKAVEGNSW